jgi:hypothetical protein
MSIDQELSMSPALLAYLSPVEITSLLLLALILFATTPVRFPFQSAPSESQSHGMKLILATCGILVAVDIIHLIIRHYVF